jgi:hypothetical protein
LSRVQAVDEVDGERNRIVSFEQRGHQRFHWKLAGFQMLGSLLVS